jgi:hypothetical protein
MLAEDEPTLRGCITARKYLPYSKLAYQAFEI